MGIKNFINKAIEKQKENEAKIIEKKESMRREKEIKKEEFNRIMASNPIVTQKDKVDKVDQSDKQVCCPKCGSTQLTSNKKGFSLGKALVGGVVLVPFVGIAGVATGGLGKNKIIITCLSCGKQFKPGR